MPCNGPSQRPALISVSACLAATPDSSVKTVAKALSSGFSCSMRCRHAATIVTGDSVPAQAPQAAQPPRPLQPAPVAPRRDITDPGAIATNQRVTPAGVQSVFTDRVFGVRFGRPG